jgi:hypothetical protein
MSTSPAGAPTALEGVERQPAALSRSEYQACTSATEAEVASTVSTFAGPEAGLPGSGLWSANALSTTVEPG